MFELTPEQRRELEGSQPARAFDPLTKETYVLVRADVFERIKAVLEPDFDIREAYPLMDSLAAKEGWADPAMDIYDDLDPRGSVTSPKSIPTEQDHFNRNCEH